MRSGHAAAGTSGHRPVPSQGAPGDTVVQRVGRVRQAELRPVTAALHGGRDSPFDAGASLPPRFAPRGRPRRGAHRQRAQARGRARQHRNRLHIGQRLVRGSTSDQGREDRALRGGSSRSVRHPAAPGRSPTPRPTPPAVEHGREHRHRADAPRARRREAVLTPRPLPRPRRAIDAEVHPQPRAEMADASWHPARAFHKRAPRAVPFTPCDFEGIRTTDEVYLEYHSSTDQEPAASPERSGSTTTCVPTRSSSTTCSRPPRTARTRWRKPTWRLAWRLYATARASRAGTRSPHPATTASRSDPVRAKPKRTSGASAAAAAPAPRSAGASRTGWRCRRPRTASRCRGARWPG